MIRQAEGHAAELVAGRQASRPADGYSAGIEGSPERAAYQDMLAKSAAYFDNSARLVDGLRSGDASLAAGAGDLRQATADAVGVLLHDGLQRLDAAVARQEAEYVTNLVSIGVLLTLALVLAAVAALLITRSIVRPLSEVMAAAKAVARGDLEADRWSSEAKSEPWPLRCGDCGDAVNLRRRATGLKAAHYAASSATSCPTEISGVYRPWPPMNDLVPRTSRRDARGRGQLHYSVGTLVRL